MREVKTLLYTDAGGRSTTITLSDDITNYDILRIYVGYESDGYGVIEWDVKGRNYASGTINAWTFYQGGVAVDNPGSLRWNLFKFNNSTREATVSRTILTYLNLGTNAYTNNTNNSWGPKPIYKIYGIKYV